ncbi:MAG: thiamine biosynthesis protein ThiS [Thermoplasmata archaeon HGW-Thermoplasmata-2]|nr:MAG: thiamine biosynthesis protein ThiS [Thermoplasmata archaeon HGW-Thermoplasmata-2]
MKISVSLMTGHKIDSKRPLSDCKTPMEALSALKISPETVIVVRKGKPIPIDEPLKDGDEIQIIGVVTGG